MKKVSPLAVLFLGALFLNNCNLISERQKCYEKKCKNAVSSCFLYSNSFINPTASSVALNESGTTGTTNDYIYPGESLSITSGSLTTISGTMSSASDVDIFVFYGPTSTSYKLDLTQTSGTASCQLYTRSAQSSSSIYTTSSTFDSTFTLVGTLSSSTALSGLKSGYNFIKCTGSSNASYSIKIDESAGFSSLSTIMLSNCIDAENVCHKGCDKKHAF